MPRLLVVHHTPSPALQEMFEAAVSGARTDEIVGTRLHQARHRAIATQLSELLDADLTGTLAIMSGILQSIREDAKPDVIASARYSADALRLELNRWRQPVRADHNVKALRAAGAAAAKR